ncbi:MAG: hypothetical protein EOP48_01830 [Sphingobacteriales bacterium]|nr:MAG: hypothetical protein EOP48_01830 [Sphingobacteriales bacterium]
MRFLLFAITLIGALIVYAFRRTQTDSRQREEERLRQQEIDRENTQKALSSILIHIREAVATFYPKTIDQRLKYFSHYDLNKWKESFKPFHLTMKGLKYESCGLDINLVKILREFDHYWVESDKLRKLYNKEFTKTELHDLTNFFDNVEGRKLDIQQRTAIVRDEDNNLIIAGAGSGKTTTIVGKVQYLIQRLQVPVDAILLISFTNKSASTLADRVGVEGLEPKTFHKFGKELIAEVESKQPSIFDDSQTKNLISTFFTDLCKDMSYLTKVTTFFSDFLKPVKSQNDFKSHGDYIQYLKDHNFTSYRLKPLISNGKTTYKREIVKSIEECKIANFLLFNGIDYEYELPYQYDTASKSHQQYKPDFTLDPKGQRIYLEHFGLDRQNQVPPFFANPAIGLTREQATKKYLDGVAWKRALHLQNGTTMLETFSYEMSEGTLFTNLEKQLLDDGVRIKRKSPEEIWKIINQSAHDEIDSFITLIRTFLMLKKSNNYSVEDLFKKNKSTEGKFNRKRNELFLEIVAPIASRYQSHLASRKEIDFNDMINKATYYIRKGKWRNPIKYIIIDEFQDISVGRYQLIRALKDKNPDCKLFCVGDDWQSIYRFAGSDISLFKDFEKYFGYTEKSKIETTYRFAGDLLSMSSSFILRNPSQTSKSLKSLSGRRPSTYKIIYSTSENQDDTESIVKVLNDLVAAGATEKTEILMLGRYSFDVNRIKNERRALDINEKNGTIIYTSEVAPQKRVTLRAQFMTVHKAKGLEADTVIIINCNSGKHGFPSGMSDDTVLNLLLSEADHFENGEERRLFYVAMTRAKQSLYLVADTTYKSKFITELELGNLPPEIKKCPQCETADLVTRSGITNGKAWSFSGCANFAYGCDFKRWN